MENKLEYQSADTDQQLSQFSSDYLLDEEKATNYDNWRQYGPIASAAGIIFGIMTLFNANDYGIWAASTIVIASISISCIILGYMMNRKKKESDLENKDVRYHDIAYAIDQFQKGNLEKVEHKLIHIRNNKSHYEHLSKSRQEELEEYIIEVEDRDEEYLDRTFEDVFEIIVEDLNRGIRTSLYEPIKDDGEATPTPIESIKVAIDIEYLRDPTIVWVFTVIAAFVSIILASQGQFELAMLLATISTGLAGLLLRNQE